MLVKDIYGGDYASQGLPGELIASSFGKAVCWSNNEGRKPFKSIWQLKDCNMRITHFDYISGQQFSEADLARSLLFTISNDIGQIASLYATVHKMDKIYFGGYFLRNHPLSMHTISYSIKYWSHVSPKNSLRFSDDIHTIYMFYRCVFSF